MARRVEVFYIIEKDTIVTVTVYVFYGKGTVKSNMKEYEK